MVRYPPDTQACIFWLRNRRRQTWQAKPADADEPDDGGDDWRTELEAAEERVRRGQEETL
jgi:hypothetical protein